MHIYAHYCACALGDLLQAKLNKIMYLRYPDMAQALCPVTIPAAASLVETTEPSLHHVTNQPTLGSGFQRRF